MHKNQDRRVHFSDEQRLYSHKCCSACTAQLKGATTDITDGDQSADLMRHDDSRAQNANVHNMQAHWNNRIRNNQGWSIFNEPPKADLHANTGSKSSGIDSSLVTYVQMIKKITDIKAVKQIGNILAQLDCETPGMDILWNSFIEKSRGLVQQEGLLSHLGSNVHQMYGGIANGHNNGNMYNANGHNFSMHNVNGPNIVHIRPSIPAAKLLAIEQQALDPVSFGRNNLDLGDGDIPNSYDKKRETKIRS